MWGWPGVFMRKMLRTKRSQRRASGRGAADRSRMEGGGESSEHVTGDLRHDVAVIQAHFGGAEDLIVRYVPMSETSPGTAALLYLDGMVSKEEIAEHIIAPLVNALRRGEDAPPGYLPAGAKFVSSIRESVEAITMGECVLIHRGRNVALRFDVKDWDHRRVGSSEAEPTLRGSKEGFTENLRSNIVLIRRRLRTSRLRVERFTLGYTSRSQVSLLYLQGIARDEMVEEIRSRIRRIDLDAVLDVNYIEEFIEDNPRSPFPSVMKTERPDRVAGHLLEGHVAVLVDGSPDALLAPSTIMNFLQSSDDYYLRHFGATLARELRWLAAFVGLLAPSLYVAVLSYHPELIPTRLLFTLAAGREGLPFPPALEALLMELAFELLREAGLRMPKLIGPALSIVGVLVIGDAAVRAGLVSPLMIVVVGMTAIAAFAVPSHEFANSIRWLRFPVLTSAGLLGLFGVFASFMGVMAFLIGGRSFGVPMFAPISPLWVKGLKDTMLRAPMWMQRHRPRYTTDQDEPTRQPAHQVPGPPPKGNGRR